MLNATKISTRSQIGQELKALSHLLIIAIVWAYGGIFLGAVAWTIFATLHVVTLKSRREAYGETESTNAFFMFTAIIILFAIAGWARG